MDRGRRARPVRPGRHRHGCQLRPGIRHRSRPRRQRCTRRARGAQPRQGHPSRRPHQEGEPNRDGRITRAGPDLIGQRPQGRRRAARHLPAHRPADQQRRRDVRAVPGDHQGRLRDAVRHQPSRPLRVDGSAARQHPARRRIASGHGEQRRPPDPGPNPFRGPAIRAQVQPGRGVRTIQTRQSAVHLRSAATAEDQGRTDGRTRRTPGILGYRTHAAPAGLIPDFVWKPFTQPADMGALPTLRAATDAGAQGGQYYGPDGLGETRGNPKVVASSAQSHNEDIQRRLWTLSEELTGVTYPL